MLVFISRRIALAILVGLAVSLLAYLLLFLSGDPAIALAGDSAREADIERIRIQYGLDRPILVQYGDWLWNLLHGNFGNSVYFKTPVAPLILDKLFTTLILGVCSLAVALAISVPLGVLAAIYRHSWIDRACLAVAVLGQALPNFFFALLLIMLLSVTWHAQMSAAEVTCPSRMEGSNDHCTSVTSLTTHASLSRFENDSSLPR